MEVSAVELATEIDRQIFDDMKRHDWDPPDDAEFCVMLTAPQLRLIDVALDTYGRCRAALGLVANQTELLDMPKYVIKAVENALQSTPNDEAGVKPASPQSTSNDE